MNPLLLLSFATVYGVYPFPDITVAHIEEAIHAGMEAENKAVAAIVDNPDAPTFENTIEALETSGELLERATTLMYNLLSAHTNDDLEDLAQRVAPILSEHGNNIMLNARLYERVKTVYSEYKPKDAEEAMLLKNTYEAFERSGATLDEAGKQRFREISAELSKLTLQFSQNKLKDTNNYYLHITDEQELDGLPELQRGAARENAAERGLEGWVITLHASYPLWPMPKAASAARNCIASTTRFAPTATSTITSPSLAASRTCAARRLNCWVIPIMPLTS